MPTEKTLWTCDYCGLDHPTGYEASECEQSHIRPQKTEVLYKPKEVLPCGVRIKLEDGRVVYFGDDKEPYGR